MAVGVMIVERANRGRHVRSDKDADGGAGDTRGKDRDDGGTRWPWGGSHASDAAIGIALIVLQSTLLVLQDVGEEILLQLPPHRDAPDGGGIWLRHQFCRGHSRTEWRRSAEVDRGRWFHPDDIAGECTMQTRISGRRACPSSSSSLAYSTSRQPRPRWPSATTRNVWKKVRTVLVWVTSLCIFYLGCDVDYGEEWHTPEPAYILFGFTVMSE